ncbi:MAG: sigma-70 family RNA polymerase sigma factor [Verrucomicrobiota bacterium]|nr:sigma-70 family RNA polymerase sigma factor [Verrucomicrobiota bacterium]
MISDQELWQQSRTGDREAFGKIVERYQTLICSLAYSNCGNLARSEDVAQETFVAAWQKLGELREPSQLRGWLCGIARNLSKNAVRRELRRGGAEASMEEIPEPVTTEADPATKAISQEEEQLLWRSLGGLPENYREPMVLFYREGQSIAQVARALDLSEETVRQRLFRGRAFLREEMTMLVESTLTRSRPGKAFTMAVLVALPVATGSTASAAMMGGTVAGGMELTGKGVLAKLGLGMLVGPVIGVLCAIFATNAVAAKARSDEERKYLVRQSRLIILFCLLMALGLAGVLSQAGTLYRASAAIVVTGVSLWAIGLVGGILWICTRMDSKIQLIRERTGTELAPEAPERVKKYVESKTRLLGLPLFAMTWGGSSEAQSRTVWAWVAIGDVAVSPFVAFGGVAIAPIAVGAISVGVLSLSVFWGFAVGVVSAGSLAFGWWALGCAAGGIQGAVGFAAIARDYAMGTVASAAEANTAVAKEWLLNGWWSEFAGLMLGQGHWWILGCVVLGLAMGWWRRERQDQQTNSSGC